MIKIKIQGFREIIQMLEQHREWAKRLRSIDYCITPMSNGEVKIKRIRFYHIWIRKVKARMVERTRR